MRKKLAEKVITKALRLISPSRLAEYMTLLESWGLGTRQDRQKEERGNPPKEHQSNTRYKGGGSSVLMRFYQSNETQDLQKKEQLKEVVPADLRVRSVSDMSIGCSQEERQTG